MINYSRGFWLACGASMLALGVALPSAAAAQDAVTPATSAATAEAPVAAPAATGDQAFGDIVVTAQRRSENLKDVPIAITAVTPAQISQLNLKTVENVQAITPNMTFNTGYGFAQLFVRGVGSNFTTAGLENAVATYVDGAYLERASGVNFNLMDIASVQTLKGPQGTLWGRNATGGAVLINTADPVDHFEAHGAFEYGRFDHVLAEGMVNVPLTDTLSARVAGRYDRDGGYVHNIYTNSELGQQHSIDIRGKLKYAPSSDFSAVLTVEHTFTREAVLPEHQLLTSPLCSGCSTPGSVSGSALGYYETDLNYVDRPMVKATSANLHIKATSGIVSIDSVTSYRDQREVARSDQDYSRANNNDYQAPTGGKTFTQDITVTTNSHSWVDGLFGLSFLHDDGYYELITDGDYQRTVNNGEIPTAYDGVKTTSVSAFGEVSVTPIARLKITAGGRYTYDDRTLRGSTNVAGNILFAGGNGQYNFGANSSFSSFVPRAVISYDAKIVNLYASYSEGFKAGGFTAPAFGPLPAVKPEKLKNYEVGAKFVSRDHKLRANLAAFYYNYSNIQVTIVDIQGTGGGIILNAGKAHAKGVEFDTSYEATKWLQLFGGFGYLHARYVNFPDASQANPGPGGGLVLESNDLAGFPLNRAPDWTGFVGANVSVPVGDYKVQLNAMARYSSAFDFVPGAGGILRLDRQPAFTLVNASGSIGPSDDKYKIGFYINNLTNAHYSISNQTSATVGAYTAPARPRTFGLRAEVNFK